jgi:hypothetical protein
MYDQDRTTPYGPPQTARVAHHIFKHGSPRVVIFAAIAGLLALALSAASLTLLLQYKSTATAQIHQLQQAVANAQAGNQSNLSSISGLSSKVSAINAAMAAITPFNQVCSTDLTNASGQPAQFYFMCSSQKPGG